MVEYNDAEAKRLQDLIDETQSSITKLTAKIEGMAPGNPTERKELRDAIEVLKRDNAALKTELAEWKAKAKERHTEFSAPVPTTTPAPEPHKTRASRIGWIGAR